MRPSEVSSLRILAVSATPAEGAPGSAVSYAALLVDGNGERSDPIDWAYCNEQKPLSELGDIASTCFVFGASYLVELGQGAAAKGTLPSQACSLFGPDVPPALPMMPPGRPADPDLTGGYYQPVRLILQADGQNVLAAGESRITCGLPGATADALAQFKMDYHPNENPVLGDLLWLEAGQDLDTQTSHATVPAGSKITLRASWPPCPGPAMAGCGAEQYAYYDPQAQTVTTRREAMTVSWFATAGSFDSDRTGRAEDDQTTTVDNGWTAPGAAGSVLLWTVLRDDRGGVSWKRYQIDLM